MEIPVFSGYHAMFLPEGNAHARLALAAHEGLHHLLGLLKLVDELVDVLHGGAAARGDALAAAGVEDAGIAALLGGHGADDGLRLFQGVVVHLLQLVGVAAHAGNNPQDGRSAVLAAAHLTIAITNLQDLEGKGTSVTVGVIEGGTVCNTVPEKCTLKIDTRCWNDEDGREIDEGIEALAKQNWGDGITVKATRVSKSPAMPCTDATKELVEMVNRAAKEEGYEATWVDAGGGSDANRIAQVGVPVIDGVAPAGAGFHSEREYLRVDTIENRVRTLSRVLQYL